MNTKPWCAALLVSAGFGFGCGSDATVGGPTSTVIVGAGAAGMNAAGGSRASAGSGGNTGTAAGGGRPGVEEGGLMAIPAAGSTGSAGGGGMNSPANASAGAPALGGGAGGAPAGGAGGSVAVAEGAGSGGAGGASGTMNAGEKCNDETPHGCYTPMADNPDGCPEQIFEQSAEYPPAAEWMGCGMAMANDTCYYETPDGEMANCWCDLNVHWTCDYPECTGPRPSTMCTEPKTYD
jgi:hypothetical protein